MGSKITRPYTLRLKRFLIPWIEKNGGRIFVNNLIEHAYWQDITTPSPKPQPEPPPNDDDDEEDGEGDTEILVPLSIHRPEYLPEGTHF